MHSNTDTAQNCTAPSCTATPSTATPSTAKTPVSAILPCYNNADYLQQCVESINAVNPPDQIVIVDDKSTDNSLAVARELALRHPNITIVARETNGGIAAARLDGYAAARNELVAIIDSDDFVEAGAVHAAYEKLQAENADMCIWDMWRYDNGKTWVNVALDARDFPKTGRQAVIDTLGQWRIHPLGVAKKSIYLAAYEQFRENMLNADELLTRIVFAKTAKVVYCPKKYYYRVNQQSTTQRLSPKSVSNLQSFIWLLRFANDYPEVKPEQIASGAIAHAWEFHRKRQALGEATVSQAISRFLHDLNATAKPWRWVWRSPKHLVAYVLLSLIYLRKPCA